MKKNLQIGRKIALAIVLMITVTMLNAQTRTASADGPWNSSTTWGGQPVPTSANDVVINPGVDVTLASGANAQCNSMTFTTSGTNTTASTLSISSGFTVSVTGAITLNNAAGNSRSASITGAGTVTAGSVIIGGTNTSPTSDASTTFTSSVAVFSITGDISVNGEDNGGSENNAVFNLGSGALSAVSITLDSDNDDNDATATFSLDNGAEDATLSLSGVTPVTATGAGTETFDLNGTSATVQFNGVNQTIPVLNYTNLIMTGSGTKTLAGNVTIIGNLTVDETVILTLGGSRITISANAARSMTINGTVNINGDGRLTESGSNTKTLILGSTGILNITDNGGAGLPALNAFSLDPASTVNFGSTDNQTIENSATYGNLTTSGSGTKTLETSGGTMNFAGTITIGNGTTLASNNKTMNVGGDFINNGSFTRGTSTVILNGSVDQELGGTTSTVFTSLTINNSSTTGVSLSNDCNVVTTLTLTDGVVNTAASPGLLTINAGASVSGGSLAAHINGPLAKTGNTGFTFPLGDGVRYRPITMSSLAGATASSVVTGRYILGNPRTAYGVAGTGPALTLKDISLCEYWDLNDGAESISAVIGLQYSSTSPCNTNGYITDAATLVVAHHNGSTWENLGAAPGATLTNLTAGMTSTFSPFTIGTTNAILNPLPVSFTEVKAFEKGTGVQIDWTNSTESDMSAYIIERSSNGIDFTAIGQTAPRSNQFDVVSYSYIDATPLAGTNFYRIKAIELSGKNVYTKSLRVDIGRSPKGISLYPNPVRGSEITIGFSALKGQYSLNVLNTAGQVVYRQQLNHAGGTVARSVALPASLKAGVYSVLISGDNYKETKMFVVQ